MSSGIVKSVSTDRVMLKSYYSKSSGFMSIMNSIFALAIAMIAFYISEYFEQIANITSDTTSSVPGMLSMVAFGYLAIMFFILGFGVAGIKRQKDENYNNQRVMAILSIVLNIFYILATLLAFTDSNNNINNPENITYFLIGVFVAVASSVYGGVIIVMTTKARKYCDRKKSKADEVNGPVSEEKLHKKTNGVILSGFGLSLFAVFMLCFAFSGIIDEYCRNLAVDYSFYSVVYMVIAIAGMVCVCAVLAGMILDIKNGQKSGMVAKISVVAGLVMVIVGVIFSISTIGKEFALPMVDGRLSYLFQYYIFMYVLAGLSAVLGVISFKRHL